MLSGVCKILQGGSGCSNIIFIEDPSNIVHNTDKRAEDRKKAIKKLEGTEVPTWWQYVFLKLGRKSLQINIRRSIVRWNNGGNDKTLWSNWRIA